MSTVAARIFILFLGGLLSSCQFSSGTATDMDKLSSIYTKLVDRMKAKSAHEEVQTIHLNQGISLCRKKLKEDLESSSRSKEDIIVSVKLCIATQILHLFHLYNQGSGLTEGELNILVEMEPDLGKFLVNNQLSTEFSIQVDSSSPDFTRDSSSSTSIDESIIENKERDDSPNTIIDPVYIDNKIDTDNTKSDYVEDTAPPLVNSLSVISPPMFGESLLSKLLSGIFGVLILMIIVATIIGCKFLTKSRKLQRENEDLVPRDESEDEMSDMDIDTKSNIPLPPALPSTYRYHRNPPVPHQLQPPYQHQQHILRHPQNCNYQLRQAV